MTLHKKIKLKLKEVQHKALLKKMGYNNLKIGEKTLQAFIDSRSIYEWLKDSHFDMKYGSEKFLIALGENLEIPHVLLNEEIKKAKDRIAITSKMKDPHIGVNTSREASPISFFMFSNLRKSLYIDMQKESLVGKDDQEIFEEVGAMILKHYHENNGEISLLGKILDYTFHHADGHKYTFTIEGVFLEQDDEEERNKKRRDEALFRKPKIILHIPHSSTKLPDNFTVDEDVSLEKEFQRMTDWYTDELFDDDKAETLVFPYSRLYCDVERFRDDGKEAMAQKGMGVCYTATSFSTRLREVSEEEKEFIKSTHYDAHHKQFEALVEEELTERGSALIVDCHSFSNEVLPHEESSVRPDICIGTDKFHTPLDWISTVSDIFKEAGLSVAINQPFIGTIVPLKFYGKDKRVKSIMIEVNRKLYLNEKFEKSENFNEVKNLIANVLHKIKTVELLNNLNMHLS